jgi:hypothetical protein
MILILTLTIKKGLRKEKKMLVKYYYLRDSKSAPRLTRCIIKTDTGEIGIGSALCSHSDFPVKKAGRKIAFERAIHALYSKKNVLPIGRQKALDVLTLVEAAKLDYMRFIKNPQLLNRDYKGLYMAEDSYLNEFETKLITKPHSDTTQEII